jgi:hypothetical protein
MTDNKDARFSGEEEQLVEDYQTVSEELQFYREELLGMVESDDQDTDLWHEYRSEMKQLGKRKMRLRQKIKEMGVPIA